jgi:peptidoglycan/LPS O-acetylase OafA/YrhL
MRRFAFLDSLRGLAAAYVVLLHMTLVPIPNLAMPHCLSGFIMLGGSGVTLFFILSAFSLCYTTPKHADDSIGIYGFYIRRFFRIAPLFYAVMAITFVRDLYFFSTYHSTWEIFGNLFFAFNFVPGLQQGIVWASWTIGVEMVFYAVFPLLLKHLNDTHKILAFIAASLIVSAALFFTMSSDANGAKNTYYTFSILRHLPIFTFGLLAYRLFANHVNNKPPSRAIGLLLIMVAIYGFVSFSGGKLTDVFFVDSYYWQAVIYSCLLLGVAIYPLPLLVNTATVYLGQISYSVYLLHPLVVLALRPLYTFIYSLPSSLPITVKFLACAATTLTVVIAIASVTYRLIEEPGMRLGKRLLAWLSSNPPSHPLVVAAMEKKTEASLP